MENFNYKELNINEYLINISNSLYNNYNTFNNEKMKILNNFKEYLSFVFQSNIELNNLFNTLEYLICQNNTNIIYNKKILILYPVIFEFNPKLTYKYIDNFLLILQKCSILNDFQFFSYLFNELIEIFFKNILNNDKEQLYIKLLNYSINLLEYNININKNNNNHILIEEEKNIEKNDSLLGFIFISILIDKYNAFNNIKILNNIWNIFSFYLNKKNYKYIYDILICTLKLINVAKEQFKIFCNLCLFTILDCLIDDNWQIRKISIEIIFYLTKYCKNEILSVKDNIIEFLNILKNDNVPTVKEVCLQTLNLIEGKESNQFIYPCNSITLNSEEKVLNIDKDNMNNNGHIINISILESENEKNNNSNENIPFVSINKKSNHKNNNNINKEKNDIYKNDNNNYNRCIKNFMENQNYSYENNEINKYQKTIQPTNRIKKKINLHKKAPYNNINNYNENKIYQNEKNNLSISKVSYSVIQNSEELLENQIMDKTASIKNKKIKPKISIHKKYVSALKRKSKFNNSDINIFNNKDISKEKYKNKNTENNNIQNYENKNLKNSLKLEIIKGYKENKYKKNINLKKKDISYDKPINLKKEINNKSISIINGNKSYLNFQKKFEKKMNNKNNIIKNDNKNNKNVNNVDKNKICKIDKKSSEKEKNVKKSEIYPKLNLLPLFTEENNKINNNSNMDRKNSNSNEIVLLTEKLNTLSKGQNMIMEIISHLEDKINNNYKNINERLVTYEGNKTKKLNKRQKDNNKKIDLIKKKYNDYKYDEALLESIQNDIYLFKLLPLIKEEDLPKINIILIEDIISRLSLKIPSILKNKNNRIYFGVILSFLNLVINSNLQLKIITKLNLKDSLNFIKDEHKYFDISTVDLNLIEKIIKSIKK